MLNFFVEGGGGANVTLPHKPAAAEIVNELSARAERARAVNTIVRRSATELYGENTDGVGPRDRPHAQPRRHASAARAC